MKQRDAVGGVGGASVGIKVSALTQSLLWDPTQRKHLKCLQNFIFGVDVVQLGSRR